MDYQQLCEKMNEKKEEAATDKRKLFRMEELLERKKEELDSLCSVLYAEKYDVDRLKKNSLNNILKKVTGSYHEVYEKEYAQYVEAKQKYDEMAVALESLKRERDTLQSRVRKGERELCELYKKLEKYPEAQEMLQEEKQKEAVVCKAAKLKETIGEVQRMIALAEEARKRYSEAKNWANYDIFFNGGLIGDIAKYDKVEEAQAICGQLVGASKELKIKLKNIKIDTTSFQNIDCSTKTVDIWFDNIFTDLRVRSQIKNNLIHLERCLDELTNLLSKLKSSLRQLESECL